MVNARALWGDDTLAIQRLLCLALWLTDAPHNHGSESLVLRLRAREKSAFVPYGFQSTWVGPNEDRCVAVLVDELFVLFSPCGFVINALICP